MDSYQFKITIGFPVYNVEKYVYKSFKSILDQEFDSFEVIVVDDCGNDQSMDIIRELTNEHPRGNIVHLVKHTKNAGLAEARNTAINNASGKYIYFVDSDDYLTPNALTTLYMTAEKYQAEVVIGSNYQQYDDKLLTKILPDKHFLDENEFKNYYYYSLKDILYSTAWNILFNIDFLNKYNLRFPNIRFQEDIAFDELYRPFIQRIVLISNITYYYLIRKDSLMNFQHRDAIGINEAQRSVEKTSRQIFRGIGRQCHQEYDKTSRILIHNFALQTVKSIQPILLYHRHPTSKDICCYHIQHLQEKRIPKNI